MNHGSRLLSLAALLAMAMLPTSGVPQSKVAFTSTCQSYGTPSWDPIDAPDHGLSVTQMSCTVAGGAMDGANVTGTMVQEYNKGKGVGISGIQVFRKADGMAVWQANNEAITVLFAPDGRPNGFRLTANGVFKWATGSLACLAGESTTHTVHSVGNRDVGEWTIN
jgi:hypothetical protein